MEMIELEDGRNVGTGLMVPAKKVSTCRSYADAGKPMLTREQILAYIHDPNRVPRRRRFAKHIKNQEHRNACNGYAAALLLELVRNLVGMKHVALSGDGIYAAINGGVDNGSMLHDAMRYAQTHGIPPESMVPHLTYKRRDISPAAWQEGEKYKGDEYFSVNDADEIYSAIASGYLIGFAWHVGRNSRAPGSDGVIRDSPGAGNHAVAGIDIAEVNGKIVVDMANSWGTSWGAAGFAYVSWENVIQYTIRNHETYAVTGAIWSPDEQMPPSISEGA